MHFKSLLNQLRDGNRLALSKAMSLAESQLLEDRRRLGCLLRALPPIPSLRVGVTGAPGVGKSALLQALAQHILNENVNDKVCEGASDEGKMVINKVAILTVDPSSSISGGSILGDKIRMATISNNENVFIRQTPTGGYLGGVSKGTYDAMRICESKG